MAKALLALEGLLASTYALYLKTQSFHWNVTGPHFFSYHQAFESQYEALAEVIDEIAEIMRTQGAHVEASFKHFDEKSVISDMPSGVVEATSMCKMLTEDHGAIVQWIRTQLSELDENQDGQVIDFLISRWQAHEKIAWMLSSTCS